MKQTTLFAKLVLLLALVGALALAGCGGDDGLVGCGSGPLLSEHR